jgi:maltose-binding protein MalE
MTVNGPWALGDYRKALGAELGTTTLPMVEDGVPAVPFVGVKCFMFNPNSGPAARERAVAFATYMTSPEIARSIWTQPHLGGAGRPGPRGDSAPSPQARWARPCPPPRR